jgi:hypothetical protein
MSYIVDALSIFSRVGATAKLNGRHLKALMHPAGVL